MPRVDTSAWMPAPKTTEPPPRTRINKPAPALDGGRYAPKRCVGDAVTVSADIFRDGHEILRAVVRYRAPGGRRWVETEMHPLDAHVNGVRWAGEFTVETPGRWEFTIEAWSDVFATWRDELQRKIGAQQQDLAGELSEGVVLLEQAADKAKAAADTPAIAHALEVLKDASAPEQSKHEAALSPELLHAVERSGERPG